MANACEVGHIAKVAPAMFRRDNAHVDVDDPITALSNEEPMPDRLLYSPEEVAVLLHIGRTRVYCLMADGRLASVRIGRSRRIPRAAICDFIDQL